MEEIIVAPKGVYLEESRALINKIFPLYQRILRHDRELVSLEKFQEILKGNDKEIIVACKDGAIIGTIVLGVSTNYAWVSHFTKALNERKGLGKDLLAFAENRAHTIHGRKKMQLSVVSHPHCTQAPLQEWYKDLGYYFLRDTHPKPEHLEDWESKYHCEVRFKWFEKDLVKVH